MKTVYILRSVSGAGKTTLAKELEESLPHAIAISADDYHYDEDGNYNFNIKNLSKPHDYCKGAFYQKICQGRPNIIIHNTNTTEKEISWYIDFADECGYKVVSLVVENRHGGVDLHNVPEETLLKQERNLRNSLKLR